MKSSKVNLKNLFMGPNRSAIISGNKSFSNFYKNSEWVTLTFLIRRISSKHSLVSVSPRAVHKNQKQQILMFLDAFKSWSSIDSKDEMDYVIVNVGTEKIMTSYGIKTNFSTDIKKSVKFDRPESAFELCDMLFDYTGQPLMIAILITHYDADKVTGEVQPLSGFENTIENKQRN